jgi:hypothetical protein
MGMQLDWRFCQKCAAMFFDGFPGKGICPADGGGHVSQGFIFALPHGIPETPTSQGAWRFCPKCFTMHFDGRPDKGHCAAGGAHVTNASDFDFILPFNVPENPTTAQGAWTFCRNCTSMFYNGRPDKGHCPANGGGHVGDGSFGFVLPHDIPMVLDFNFAPIVFGAGIAAGGNAHLTLRSDGSYTFSGHFHDSGAAEYSTALAWAVKDSQNRVYTFQHAGHIAGTFESGSREDNWTVDSRNDQIAANWANLGAGATETARADVNTDLVNLTNGLIGVVGLVVGVIGIVVAAPAA